MWVLLMFFFLPQRKTKQKNQEGMGELKQTKLDETRRTLAALASCVKMYFIRLSILLFSRHNVKGNHWVMQWKDIIFSLSPFPTPFPRNPLHPCVTTFFMFFSK